MSEECNNCRFHVEDECRRRPPAPHNFLLFYQLELVRDIAVSLRKLSRREITDDPLNPLDDVTLEATEAAKEASWPEVLPYEWCGEWETNTPSPSRTRTPADEGGTS